MNPLIKEISIPEPPIYPRRYHRFAKIRRYALILQSAELLLCLLGTLILSGCVNLRLPASPQTHYQKKTHTERARDLKKITRWHITGAFSIQGSKNSVIASYDWEQNNNQYKFSIHSSLHLYNVLIVGRAQQVTLFTSDKQHYTATTPEQLLQKELGWALPVSNLSYWIRGLAAPGAHHAQMDAYGHLLELHQAQWTLHFSRYLSVGGVDLPQILQLNSGPLRIKIVVKQGQWATH